MSIWSIIAVMFAIVAVLGAVWAIIAVISIKTSVLSVNNRSLGHADAISALRTAFARVDLDHIKKILSDQLDLHQDCKVVQKDVDLLNEKLTSFINREAGRAKSKEATTAASATPKNGKQQDILELLKANGGAVPLDEAAPDVTKPQEFIKMSEAMTRR